MAPVSRPRPLIAIVYSVPLFVEAVVAAFDGIADVQAIRADDSGLGGLVQALWPDALIVEAPSLEVFRLDVPAVHVRLEEQVVDLIIEGTVSRLDMDLSGEAIRNVVVEAMLVGVGR